MTMKIVPATAPTACLGVIRKTRRATCPTEPVLLYFEPACKSLGMAPHDVRHFGEGSPSCKRTTILLLRLGLKHAFVSSRAPCGLAVVTYLSPGGLQTDLAAADVHFSRGESIAGSRGCGLLRGLLVRPRGPREERAPATARCAHSAGIPRPATAREVLRRG